MVNELAQFSGNDTFMESMDRKGAGRGYNGMEFPFNSQPS